MKEVFKSLIIQANSECEMAFLETTKEDSQGILEIRYDPKPVDFNGRSLIFVTLIGDETICDHYKKKLSELREFETRAYETLVNTFTNVVSQV